MVSFLNFWEQSPRSNQKGEPTVSVWLTLGLGRISQQQGTTPEYFLGDALGSVRQLTDQSGAITYARAYDPGVYPDGSSFAHRVEWAW